MISVFWYNARCWTEGFMCCWSIKNQFSAPEGRQTQRFGEQAPERPRLRGRSPSSREAPRGPPLSSAGTSARERERRGRERRERRGKERERKEGKGRGGRPAAAPPAAAPTRGGLAAPPGGGSPQAGSAQPHRPLARPVAKIASAPHRAPQQAHTPLRGSVHPNNKEKKKSNLRFNILFT